MSADDSGREFDFLVDDDPINTEISAYNELATHVRRSDAELIKLRAEIEWLWQPMETAPKDGTRVILDWGGKSRVGYYLDNSHSPMPWEGWRVPSMEEFPRGTEPEYWMPLPTTTAREEQVMNDCVINPYSSGACVLGTKSCVIKHIGVKQMKDTVDLLNERIEYLLAKNEQLAADANRYNKIKRMNFGTFKALVAERMTGWGKGTTLDDLIDRLDIG